MATAASLLDTETFSASTRDALDRVPMRQKTHTHARGVKGLALTVSLTQVACGYRADCIQHERVSFTLNPDLPQILISARSETSDALHITYVGTGSMREPEFIATEPCRVAIYNYGTERPAAPWPMPGDSPQEAAVVDYDFVLLQDDVSELRVEDYIVELQYGPVEGNLLIASCGTATVEGELWIVGMCAEAKGKKKGDRFFSYDFDVVTQQSP
jgi:hypothetical protein